MTPERNEAYRALLSQALFDGDFYALRGKQGDKAIANRFYNLLPLIAELREADRGAKGTAMNDKAAAVVSEERVLRACNAYDDARDGEDRAEYPAMHAALQAALGVGGWRPMDEAPKDGTYILVTNEGSSGSWVARYRPVYQSGYRPENPWQSMMLNHQHITQRSHLPTKWQPLPPPPASEEG